jgi:hypothetical protein
MCLEVIAQFPENASAKMSPRRLSGLAGLSVSATKFENRSALHFSVTGGCSCEFMAEDAQPNDPVWDLAPENREKLAKAIAILAKECKKFSFIAWWHGIEHVERCAERISAIKLVEMISSNNLKNNTLFHVGHAG